MRNILVIREAWGHTMVITQSGCRDGHFPDMLQLIPSDPDVDVASPSILRDCARRLGGNNDQIKRNSSLLNPGPYGMFPIVVTIYKIHLLDKIKS